MRSILAQIFLAKQINIFIAKSVSQQWLNNYICGPSSHGWFLLTCKLLFKGTSLSNPKWICSHKDWNLGEDVSVHYSNQDLWSQFFQHYTFNHFACQQHLFAIFLVKTSYKMSVSITSINYNPTTAPRYLDQRYYINKLELEGKNMMPLPINLNAYSDTGFYASDTIRSQDPAKKKMKKVLLNKKFLTKLLYQHIKSPELNT